MSTLHHDKCGGTISAGFGIKVAAVSIAVNGANIQPGALQIIKAVEGKTNNSPVSWMCLQCGKEVPPEEMIIVCPVCGNTHPVADSVYTSFTPFAGRECLTKYIESHPASFPKGAKMHELLTALKKSNLQLP